jgi:hypothetical protein
MSGIFAQARTGVFGVCFIWSAKGSMPHRRHPGKTRPSVPIGTDAEYRQALRDLEVLKKAPLGTDQTEGLQDLIEAILEYEEKLDHVDGKGSCC